MHAKRIKIYHSRWHLAATFGVIAVPFLAFLAVSRFAQIGSADLFRNILISSLRLLAAYVIAAAFAWIWAASFHSGRRAAIALPFFDVLQSFPTFAALPTAVIFFGASNTTVIVFLVFTIIWPIFFSIISSLKLVKRDWEEAVHISGIRGTAYIKKFLWPASVPGLVTGSIVGLGEGWEALVATEIVVQTQSGLGSFFNAFSRFPGITAFGILGLLLLIFSMNKLIWLPLLERSHRMMEE